MTRRDLQLSAREKGRPWDLGKDVEHSSVLSQVVSMPGKVIDKGALELLLFTGTPEGVGPVLPGEWIDGRIEGVGTIVLHIGPAE